MKKVSRSTTITVCSVVAAVYLLSTALYYFFAGSRDGGTLYILGILNVLVLAFCLFMILRLRRSQKEELKAAVAKAESANCTKALFLNNMSHDIRTPLNAIKGYASLARTRLDDKDLVVDLLDKIGSASNDLMGLVDKVLDISKVEMGDIILEEVPFDIVDKIYLLAESVSAAAGLKGIKIAPVISPVKNSRVKGDLFRLRQILGNILDNAIKYTPDGGRVFLTLSQTECERKGYGTFVISAEDNGIGMDKDFVEMLFDPFARGRAQMNGAVQGAGLGMFVVKTLVDMMDGTVSVDSAPGRGTKVSVALPFKLQDPAEMKPSAYRSNGDNDALQGKRALLVEDNEMNREIAAMLLEGQGIEVVTAEDGDVAVEIMKGVAERKEWDYFSFILMDIQMPRMNGYEASKAIRDIQAPAGVHIPIIAMTANAFTEDKRDAKQAGMDDHISKPIDLDVLWKTLKRFV